MSYIKRKPLKPDKLAELFILIRAGGPESKRARDTVILHNMGLVAKIAKKYAGPLFYEEDLIQEGVIGLMRAIDDYDPARNTFPAYARWWIFQYIVRSIHNTGNLIRIPVSAHQKAVQVKHWESKIKESTGKIPDDQAIAEVSGMDAEYIAEYRNVLNLNAYSSISEVCSSQDEEYIQFKQLEIPDEQPPALQRYELEELGMALQFALKRLTAQERLVLLSRCGAETGDAMTLKEIGDTMHRSRERIRQIERQALTKLKYNRWRKHLRDFLAA